MNNIIDSHSHLGLGLNKKIATIDDYKRIRNNLGITYSLLMPQPIFDDEIPKSEQLFDQINNNIYEEIIKNKDDSISFVPMVSSIYTSPNKLEKYIEMYNPLALKIHMKSDNSNPDLISLAWIRIIKKYDLPIIVHTDYSKNNNSNLEKLKNLNSSLNWMLFFEKYDIKGYLTHGARLNKYVLENINKSNNILIGIGPDLLLKNYSPKCLEQRGEYLKILYDNVDPSKLVFDIDFNWNIDLNGSIDLNSITRLEKYWNDEQLRKILCENSKNFFNIKIKEKRI